jgi:hypothetical protein
MKRVITKHEASPLESSIETVSIGTNKPNIRLKQGVVSDKMADV